MFILLSETHTFMYIQVIICVVHFVDLSIFVILHLSKDITFNIPVWTVVYSSQICYPDYSCRGPTLQWKLKNFAVGPIYFFNFKHKNEHFVQKDHFYCNLEATICTVSKETLWKETKEFLQKPDYPRRPGFVIYIFLNRFSKQRITFLNW